MAEPPKQTPSGIERRSSPRRPIKLDATLTYQALKDTPCELVDFCPEGVFVAYSDQTSLSLDRLHFSPGQQLELSFFDELTATQHRLQVRAVRTVQGAFGGIFTEGNVAAITSLLRICAAHPPSENGQEGGRPDSSQFLLRQAERILHTRLTPLLTDFIRSLPKQFKVATERAATAQQRGELEDASFSLRQSSGAVVPRFFECITRALEVRPSQEEARSARSESVESVDEASFEDWLTLKVMVTKAETQYRHLLLPLKLRLDAAGIRGEQGYLNPFGPALFCHALRDTLVQLQLPLSAERLCLRQFENSILRKLEPIYVELNELLTRQGVLPELDLTRYLQTSRSNGPATGTKNSTSEKSRPGSGSDNGKGMLEAARRGTTRDAYSTAEGTARRMQPPHLKVVTGQKMPSSEPSAVTTNALPKENATLVPQQGFGAAFRQSSASGLVSRTPRPSLEVCLATLHQLAKRVPENCLTPPLEQMLASAGKETYSNEELLRQMRSAQARPEVPDLYRYSLQRRFAALVKENQLAIKQLTKEQRWGLLLVDSFFYCVLENPRLSDNAKRQLRGLDVAVLRLQLSTPELFASQDNPVHAVINTIAQLGNKGGPAKPAMDEKLYRIVQQIQGNQQLGTRAFSQQLAALDSLVEHQKTQARRNIERVVAAAKGQQKVTAAKRRVSQELALRFPDGQIPGVIAQLLKSGWLDYLSLIHVRNGESEAWLDSWDVVDCLADPEAKVGQPELHNLLLEKVRAGLDQVAVPRLTQSKVGAIIRNFIEKGREPAPEPMESLAISAATNPVDLLQQEARKRGLSRWLGRVQKLQLGDWLRLERDDPLHEYIQLIWLGENLSRFVFVNIEGVKMLDLDALSLAAYFQQAIVIQEPGVDQRLIPETLLMMVRESYRHTVRMNTQESTTALLTQGEFLRQLIQRQRELQPDQSLTCMMAVLENLRVAKDQAGEEIEEKLVRLAADRLRLFVPDGSLLSYLGNGEFVICLSEPGHFWPKAIVANLEHARVRWEGLEIPIEARLGYFTFGRGLFSPGNFYQLLRQISSRAAGQQRVAEGGAAELANLIKQFSLPHENGMLDERVLRQRAVLRCQKILPLHPRAQQEIQFEILLSLYAKGGELLSAGSFIQALEEGCNLEILDRWVLGEVLDWSVQNREALARSGGIVVKLSGHSLNDQSLLEFIFEHLTRVNAPLEKFTFEITNATAISHLHDIADFIRELQEYGCNFILGDFAPNDRSYQLLELLPAERVKIHPAYIRDLAESQDARALVEVMIDIAHSWGREVVAPQVEQKEVLPLLRELGVDYVQGYAVGRPKTLANIWEKS